MKVYVYPADLHGCGHFRMIWPARAAKKLGCDVTIIEPRNRAAAFRAGLDAADNVVDVQVPPDADVIVLQRITHRYMVQAAQLLHRRGIAIVIDMDDDLAAIHPSNPTFLAMHPKYGVNKDHSWLHAQEACESATLVTVSTEALLKRYAPHGRGVLLRNCAPSFYLDIPHSDSDVIGWGGSTYSHAEDLPIVGTALAQLEREGAKLKIVGDGDGVQKLLGLEREPESTGPIGTTSGWPEALATLGIGIAPLADSMFNKSKSRLKALEYSALGVPWVASPSVEYRHIHELGLGQLAGKPRQWLAKLRELRSNARLREEQSQAGRALVAEQLTIEGNIHRWVEAWELAHKLAQRAR